MGLNNTRSLQRESGNLLCVDFIGPMLFFASFSLEWDCAQPTKTFHANGFNCLPSGFLWWMFPMGVGEMLRGAVVANSRDPLLNLASFLP